MAQQSVSLFLLHPIFYILLIGQIHSLNLKGSGNLRIYFYTFLFLQSSNWSHML